jgi:DNA-binding protein H-NS
MTESYKALLQQRELLEQKIKEAREVELASAVAMVREIVAEYALSEDDVFPKGRGSRPSSAAVSSVAPKYRNPETGQTWTGRGKPPLWIKDKDRAQFAI